MRPQASLGRDRHTNAREHASGRDAGGRQTGQLHRARGDADGARRAAAVLAGGARERARGAEPLRADDRAVAAAVFHSLVAAAAARAAGHPRQMALPRDAKALRHRRRGRVGAAAGRDGRVPARCGRRGPAAAQRCAHARAGRTRARAVQQFRPGWGWSCTLPARCARACSNSAPASARCRA